MIEAALLNVLIIDERVAERGYDIIVKDEDDKANANELYGGDMRIHAAKKAGLYICTHIDRGKGGEEPIHKSVDNKYPRLVVKLAENVTNYQLESVYWKESNEGKPKTLYGHSLIIHQGIMEDFLKIPCLEVFIDNLRTHFPYIVVDSGRSIPPTLPNSSKYMPFSLLENWILSKRLSKYSVVTFIMSLNRRMAS